MFYKFPSTPYMGAHEASGRKDRTISREEAEKILTKPVYVEEKIDGANLGVSFDGNGQLFLQNRGSYLNEPFDGQWRVLKEWIRIYEDRMFDSLTDEYILFGEWCYAVHSVFYDALPDWFVGFDICEKKTGKFLSVENRNRMLKRIGVECVPLLGQGIYSFEELKQFFGKSQFGTEEREGIYIRQDEGDYLCSRMKAVRDDFRQEIEVHWTKKELRHNRRVFANARINKSE